MFHSILRSFSIAWNPREGCRAILFVEEAGILRVLRPPRYIKPGKKKRARSLHKKRDAITCTEYNLTIGRAQRAGHLLAPVIWDVLADLCVGHDILFLWQFTNLADGPEIEKSNSQKHDQYRHHGDDDSPLARTVRTDRALLGRQG